MTCVTALTLGMYLIFGGSCHKYDFCCDKHVFIMTKHFFCHDKSRQNFCHDKIMFAATKIFCHDKHNFVMTKLQHTFVVTKDMFCCNKHVFCCDKQVCVMTNFLLRQKWYLWQLPPVIESCVLTLPTEQAWTGCWLDGRSPAVTLDGVF